MRILSIDRKRGSVKVVPEDREDLWLLSLLIDEGDLVEGIATRRIKKEDERGSGRLVKFRARIRVKDVEFTGSQLKVTGTLEDVPDEVAGRGKHQSIYFKEGDEIKIIKPKLDDHIVEELRNAEEQSKVPPVGIVVVTDSEATVAVHQRRTKVMGEVRRYSEESLAEFFGDVAKKMEDLDVESVVVGGSKVVLDDFKKFLEEKGTGKKVHFVVTPLSGEKGVKDVVSKRGAEIIKDVRRKEVEEGVERFLAELGKESGLASFTPLEDVEMGNVELLLVHEDFVKDNKALAHRIMKLAKSYGAKVYIVQKDYPSEAIVRKLGGLLVIRRYSP